MITDQEFVLLLNRMEDETLDFKAEGYDLSQDRSKFAFVKDVICMANTPRESDSFIVLGVKKYPNGTYDHKGLSSHSDDADLQQQFTDRIYPIPTFSYVPVTFQGVQFGVVVIPPVKKGPCSPMRDLGDALRKWVTYYRRGSMNAQVPPEDLHRVLAWFGKEGAILTPPGDASPAWERFMNACYELDPNRYYFLIVDHLDTSPAVDLPALARIPWAGAVDFDPNSDLSGLLGSCKQAIEEQRSLHIVIPQERPVVNLRYATYWLFARGLAGRETSLELGSWNKWQRTHGAAVGEHLRRLAAASSPTQVVFIVLWYGSSLNRHLQAVLDSTVAAFGDSASIVIVTDGASALGDVATDVDATVVEMPLHQFCSGVMSLARARSPKSEDGVLLPSSSGAPVHLSAEDRAWMAEELDVVHLTEGESPASDRDVGRDFLRGSEISWYELGLHYDIDRDLFEKLSRQVLAELAGRRTTRVNLYHSPGAGGTTMARRMVWSLHEKFPCCVLRRTQPHETAQRLYRLASLTSLPLLLLVDGSEIAAKEVDEIYDVLRSRHVPVTILQVLRRFSVQEEGRRAFYLKTGLSDREASRLEHILEREVPERKANLEGLLSMDQPSMRSAFFFGLVAFQRDFLGLEPFVRTRLQLLTQTQKSAIGFLALAHHYGHRAIPQQAFGNLMGIPPTRPVQLESLLPTPAMELVVQAERGSWRTSHDLIAMEVLEQLLGSDVGERRLWRQNLPDWAVVFAQFCRGTSPIPSEEMLDIARRTFIYRDNSELLGTERSATMHFAQLIDDIPSREGALRVLRTLSDLYPEEAHFWAHLGRFYSLEMQDFDAALACIEQAIVIDAQDTVLMHMQGMIFRRQVYRLMDARADVGDIMAVVTQASNAFRQARELGPDNEHAYISEVQMLIRLADYAGRKHPDGVLGYIAMQSVDPAMRDILDSAEDLLERVRRNREGEGASPYEEESRARLEALYGRHDVALQTWDNILHRSDVYAPPIRRQITWTILSRRGHSWAKVSAKEAERIASLLEENLKAEPHNDSNLRLWLQAVRRTTNPPSIDSIIERISYWRASSNSLDASYYLYVMYALTALEGSALGREQALRFVEECRTRARFRRNRSTSFEWLGTGPGIKCLVHQSQLGEWSAEHDFWSVTEPLARAAGRIAKIDAPQAGEIEVQGGLPAFFVPARGGFNRGHSENTRVSCYIGFSYDGLRAWEVQPE